MVLETEVTNEASLKLYRRLGFIRTKRLHRYYLNGSTAFRLVLLLRAPEERGGTHFQAQEDTTGTYSMDNIPTLQPTAGA